MAQFDLSSYIDTQSRVNRFWEERNATEQLGFIHTELLSDADNDSFVMIKASVGYHDLDEGIQIVVATGIASETRTYATERGTTGHNRVNETSWVENCETSAIGRALANLGYATAGDDRPSREEMAKVNNYEAATQNAGSSTTGAPSASRPASGGGGYRQPAARGGTPPSIQNPTATPTEKQISLIMDMAKGKHEDIAYAMFEREFSQINRQQASDMIGELMSQPKAPRKPAQEVVIIEDGPAPEEHEF